MAERSNTDAPAHAQGLILGAVGIGVLSLALYFTSSIVSNENGGISAMVRLIGILLAAFAFVKPKSGLYIITVEAFTVDFIKKVAVYYGSASTETVIDVLVVTMLAIVATILGVTMQGVALRRFRIAPVHWAIFLASVVLGVAIFFASREGAGFAKAGEDAFNASILIGLAVPMSIFMTDRAELIKLLKLQFWLAVLWAVWGIKQYYTGFLPMEWYYAETGISSVASAHMLMFQEPRPFGFGSGAPNYGVISAYAVFGLWQLSYEKKGRLLYMLGTAIVLWGLVTSLQRTVLVFPLIVWVFYHLFRTVWRTIITYAVLVVSFILGVAFSETLVLHLDDVNQLIGFRGEWAEKVLVVSTFSDRLYSWELLTRSSTYSLFGINENIGTHDIFTRILISYGVVGLGLVVGVLGTTAYYMHRTVLKIEDLEDRKFTNFLLAATVPNVFLGLAGGGNFTSNPTNLQIWTFFGAAVAIIVNSKLVVPERKPVIIRRANVPRPGGVLTEVRDRIPGLS